ncbi:MAG TPA: hypothetical protein VJ901_06460 [Thermoanaerobaculia bacterium]|nr:hypothetical protein [Thermoanaerobaculia bacterium]
MRLFGRDEAAVVRARDAGDVLRSVRFSRSERAGRLHIEHVHRSGCAVCDESFRGGERHVRVVECCDLGRESDRTVFSHALRDDRCGVVCRIELRPDRNHRIAAAHEPAIRRGTIEGESVRHAKVIVDCAQRERSAVDRQHQRPAVRPGNQIEPVRRRYDLAQVVIQRRKIEQAFAAPRDEKTMTVPDDAIDLRVVAGTDDDAVRIERVAGFGEPTLKPET